MKGISEVEFGEGLSAGGPMCWKSQIALEACVSWNPCAEDRSCDNSMISSLDCLVVGSKSTGR